MNRRFPAWILPTTAAAVIVVVAAWLGAAWYLHEPPNYTLIHCTNGISRGPMVTAAYLMQRHKLTRDDALTRLRAKRPDVRPNRAFMERLAEWEAELTAAGPRKE